MTFILVPSNLGINYEGHKRVFAFHEVCVCVLGGGGVYLRNPQVMEKYWVCFTLPMSFDKE